MIGFPTDNPLLEIEISVEDPLLAAPLGSRLKRQDETKNLENSIAAFISSFLAERYNARVGIQARMVGNWPPRIYIQPPLDSLDEQVASDE